MIYALSRILFPVSMFPYGLFVSALGLPAWQTGVLCAAPIVGFAIGAIRDPDH